MQSLAEENAERKRNGLVHGASHKMDLPQYVIVDGKERDSFMALILLLSDDASWDGIFAIINDPAQDILRGSIEVLQCRVKAAFKLNKFTTSAYFAEQLKYLENAVDLRKSNYS